MNLKGKLLFGIVPIIVITTLSLGFVAYSQLGRQKEQDKVQQLRLVIEQVSMRTNAFVKDANASINILSKSNQILRYVTIQGNERRKARLLPALNELFTTYQNQYPEYSEIQLFTKEGEDSCSKLALPYSGNLSPKASTQFCEHMVSNKLESHSSFISDSELGQAAFVFGRRIEIRNPYEPSDDDVSMLRGYLVVTADAKEFGASAIRFNKAQAKSYFLLTNEGRFVFHSDKDRIGTVVPSAQKLLRSAKVVAESERIFDQKDKLLSTTFDGYDALYEAKVLHNNLVLVGILPIAAFREVQLKLAMIVALVTLVAILVTTLTLWATLKALVLSPIRKLQEISEAIGDRRSVLPANSVRKDEIGQLEKSFYDMNAKLDSSMAEIEKSHEHIEQLAYVDSLTGLPNRRRFISLLDDAIEKANTTGISYKIAIYFIDVDDFKRVNDLLGHDAGNLLLQEISKRLTTVVSATNTQTSLVESAVVGRIGGDEFVLMVPGLTNESETFEVADDVLTVFGLPIFIDNQQFTMAASIGAAMYPDHGESVNELLKSADTAMYEVKLTNKNGYCLFNTEMTYKVENKAQLEYDLRHAIKRKEIYLVYQPQVGTFEEETVGFETLIRWNHPEKGNIPPTEFIPIVEEFGLIGTYGFWVLDQACAQWRQWSNEGIAPTRVAVNVSPLQLSQVNLKEQVEQVLERYNMPACALEIELTESCIIEAPTQVINTIEELRKLGTRVALDDFGTGYSSLSALAMLPIDTIKLDRSFISDISEDSKNGRIVSAVLSLANALELESVAEGVETESEQLFLKQNNCDVLQGYLLSRPLDVESATKWLRSRASDKDYNKAA